MWAWLTTLDDQHELLDLPSPLPPEIRVPTRNAQRYSMFTGNPPIDVPLWRERVFVRIAPQAYVECKDR